MWSVGVLAGRNAKDKPTVRDFERAKLFDIRPSLRSITSLDKAVAQQVIGTLSSETMKEGNDHERANGPW